MLEDEIDGNLNHSDDKDISSLSDDIKSRIPGKYSNSAYPVEMAHAVASHQGLHCFSIHPFIGFLSKECFCLYPWYEVCRGYIVYAFSVIMFVCLSVCLFVFVCLSVNFFFPSKIISQQLLGLGF